MFDPKVFNNELQDIWETIVSNLMSFVLTENIVERAFFMGEIAENAFECNCLFQISGKVFTPKETSIQVGLSKREYENRIYSILHSGNEELERIKKLFEEVKQEHPKVIRLIYDTQKNSLDCRFDYELISNQDYEFFEAVQEWKEELNAALASAQH